MRVSVQPLRTNSMFLIYFAAAVLQSLDLLPTHTIHLVSLVTKFHGNSEIRVSVIFELSKQLFGIETGKKGSLL